MTAFTQPVTLFSIPKAFHRNVGIAQTNAIRSWLALCPAPRIVLLGDDEGTADIVANLGLEHLPTVARNEFGTPLLSSAFALAHEVTTQGLMIYVNADIILTSDLWRAIKAAPAGDFLLIGRRTNMYVRDLIDYDQDDWEQSLRRRASAKGRLWGPTAIDYFVFPHHMFPKVPNFAVGRGWWDHWLVAEALRTGATLIDASPSVLAIHQNHDFLATEESLRNLALYGLPSGTVSTNLAKYVIEDGKLHPRSITRSSHIRRALRALYRLISRDRFQAHT